MQDKQQKKLLFLTWKGVMNSRPQTLTGDLFVLRVRVCVCVCVCACVRDKAQEDGTKLKPI